MPRGDNPKSKANLIVNSERTPKQRKEQASKAGKASGEARALYASINSDLRECCTPELVRKMNERLISMAEHGNLRAYELIRDGLGEKPQSRVQLSAQQDDMTKMEEILRQMGMTDEQPDTVTEI